MKLPKLTDRHGLTGFGFSLMLIAIVTVVGPLLIAAISFGPIRISCERQADAMGVEHRWGFWEGCLVVHDGTVVQLDELRRVR